MTEPRPSATPDARRDRRRAGRARRLVGSVRRADVGARRALPARRSASTAGSPTSTSTARSRMRGCSPRRASSTRDDLAAIERGLRRDPRPRSTPARFAWSIERRGRAPQHREAPDRAGRRAPASACTPARSRNDQVATDLRLWLRGEIDATRRAAAALARGTGRPRGTSRRNDHARLHAPAGGAAGHFRPPPARLRGDARPRQRAARRLPPARQPAAARQRRARRHELPDRPRRASRASSASRRCAATRSTRCPIATSRSSSPAARRSRCCTCRASPRSSSLWSSPRFGFVDARRPLLHRQLDHAAEEESRRARAGARQDRRACSATCARCSC